MATNFYTNLDCVKKFVDELNRTQPVMQPLVDDMVVVHATEHSTIRLTVYSRCWNVAGDLTVELNLPNHMTVSKFEEWVKRNC